MAQIVEKNIQSGDQLLIIMISGRIGRPLVKKTRHYNLYTGPINSLVRSEVLTSASIKVLCNAASLLLTNVLEEHPASILRPEKSQVSPGRRCVSTKLYSVRNRKTVTLIK
jgi:hypothetical protein